MNKTSKYPPYHTRAQFILAHPDVSVALVGFSNLDQIKEAVESIDIDPMSINQIGKLRGLWSQDKW